MRLRRDIFKSPVAPVSEEPIRHRFIGKRPTVVLNPGGEKAFFTVGETEVYIVADEEIQPAVVIKIHKRGANAPVWVVCAGHLRNVSKCPITVVTPHLIVAEIGDIQVDPAVVVVVTCSDTHSVAASVDSTLLRHVSEPDRSTAVRMHH